MAVPPRGQLVLRGVVLGRMEWWGRPSHIPGSKVAPGGADGCVEVARESGAPPWSLAGAVGASRSANSPAMTPTSSLLQGQKVCY